MLTTLITYIFIIIGSLLIIMNYLAMYYSYRNKKHISGTPFFGGSLLALGLFLLQNSLSQYWWLPLLIDYCCIPVVLVWLYHNLVHRNK